MPVSVISLTRWTTSRILLRNECLSEHNVHVHPDALWVALMNCIKNAIDAYLAPTEGKKRRLSGSHSVRVVSHDDPEQPEDYCLISICDEAGGIPADIVSLVGRDLVSTKGEKGTGLGFQIVVETVKRLGGSVLIATSVESDGRPAGTIVSLKLPRHADAAPLSEAEDSPVVVNDITAHFDLVQSN